jgi:hypothetical protein
VLDIDASEFLTGQAHNVSLEGTMSLSNFDPFTGVSFLYGIPESCHCLEPTHVSIVDIYHDYQQRQLFAWIIDRPTLSL